MKCPSVFGNDRHHCLSSGDYDDRRSHVSWPQLLTVVMKAVESVSVGAYNTLEKGKEWEMVEETYMGCQDIGEKMLSWEGNRGIYREK